MNNLQKFFNDTTELKKLEIYTLMVIDLYIVFIIYLKI